MSEIPSSSITDKCALPTLSFELHEACAAWPEMSPPELRDLSDDIFVNGLREPITLTPNGRLLDGRNRALACHMAGVEPATVVYEGDPWLYSLSKNKHRRHLTNDQLAIVAAKLATCGEGAPVGNQNASKTTGSSEPVVSGRELSVAQVADASGIPETAIKSAKVVLRHGTPEEKKRVESGAARYARPPTGSVPVCAVRKWSRERRLPPMTRLRMLPAISSARSVMARGAPCPRWPQLSTLRPA